MSAYIIEPCGTNCYRVRVKPRWWRPSTWSLYLSKGRHSEPAPAPSTPDWYFRSYAESFYSVDDARRALSVQLRRERMDKDYDEAQKSARSKHKRTKPVVVTDEECDT